MGEQMTADLVISALNMALRTRRPDSVIHHSDQGSQYTSIAFGSRCREMGVRPSMGTVGDAYDNAMAESFFATLECELINRRSWKSKADARTALFIWIEGWYNPRRRHSALDYLSPINFERKYVDHENRAQQQGCPPRRSVRRKRRPPPWTTLHLRNHRLENQAITCPWDGVKTNFMAWIHGVPGAARPNSSLQLVKNECLCIQLGRCTCREIMPKLPDDRRALYLGTPS
jgi:hypothetical protein